MILDFHTHCYPAHLAKAALSRRTIDSQLPNGTLPDLLSDLDQAGIQRAVVLHVAHKPGSTAAVNNFAAELQSSFPLRLFCLGSVHPDAPNAVEELARIQALGLHGIKLHPMFQGFSPTNPRYFSLYHELGRLGLPVLFHCGKHPGLPIVLQPREMAEILPHLDGAPVVGAHLCGLHDDWDQLPLLASLPIYVDLAYCAHYYSDSEVSRILDALPSNRILFGSDSPWDSAAVQLNQLNRLGLSCAETERLLWFNGSALLDTAQKKSAN